MSTGRRPPSYPFNKRRVRQKPTRWTRYLLNDEPRHSPYHLPPITSSSAAFSSSSSSHCPNTILYTNKAALVSPNNHTRVYLTHNRLKQTLSLTPTPTPTLTTPPAPTATLAGDGKVDVPAIAGPLRPVIAIVRWRRRRGNRTISEEKDLIRGCVQVLGQFNKKLARLHFLLVLIGMPEAATKKLFDELAAHRRGCMEMCWHIRDNLFSKMTVAALQGNAVVYVRTLTDCLEMYSKELSILSRMHLTDLLNYTLQNSETKKKSKAWGKKVAPVNNDKPDEIQKDMLATERLEVQELLQMISNKLITRLDGDNDQIVSAEPSTVQHSPVVNVRKAMHPRHILLCCDCFYAKEFR